MSTTQALQVGALAVAIGSVANTHGLDREPAFHTVGLRMSDGQAFVTNAGNVIVVPELPNGLTIRTLMEGLASGEIVLLGKDLPPLAVASYVRDDATGEIVSVSPQPLDGSGDGPGPLLAITPELMDAMHARIAELEAKVKAYEESEPSNTDPQRTPSETTEPLKIPSVPSSTIEALVVLGFDTRDKIRQASDQELLAVDGIGAAVLTRIRAFLSEEEN